MGKDFGAASGARAGRGSRVPCLEPLEPRQLLSVGTILAGQTKTASISKPAEQDVYYFNAKAGHRVTIQMTTIAGKLAPVADLYGPEGKLIYSGFGMASVTEAQLLTRTGRYSIVCHDWTHGETGKYRLTMIDIPGPNKRVAGRRRVIHSLAAPVLGGPLRKSMDNIGDGIRLNRLGVGTLTAGLLT